MQSNNPCEDRIIVESPIPGMLVAGVADGHGGTFVSDVIKMEMGSMVKRIFGDIRSSR
jgi:protein phosphatase 2C